MTLTTTLLPKPGEVRSLTGLRGVAALYVVVFHFFQPITLTGGHLLCLAGHGYIAVDLFFCLSGAVMAMTYRRVGERGFTRSDYRRFFLRRFARIYPLYIVTLLIATFLASTGHLDISRSTLSSSFWPDVFLVQNWGHWSTIDTPAWSISVECVAYLLFPFLLPVLMAKGRARMWLFALGGIVIEAGLFAYAVQQQTGPKYMDFTHGPLSLLRGTGEFMLGMVVFKLTISPGLQRLRVPAYVVPAITLAIVLLLMFPGTDLAVILLFPFLILLIDSSANLVSRLLSSSLLERLGLLSFSIYLLHFLLNPLVDLVDSFARSRGYAHAHSYGVTAAVVVLWPLAELSYKRLEQPCRDWLRRVLERNLHASGSLRLPGLQEEKR